MHCIYVKFSYFFLLFCGFVFFFSKDKRSVYIEVNELAYFFFFFCSQQDRIYSKANSSALIQQGTALWFPKMEENRVNY